MNFKPFTTDPLEEGKVYYVRMVVETNNLVYNMQHISPTCTITVVHKCHGEIFTPPSVPSIIYNMKTHDTIEYEIVDLEHWTKQFEALGDCAPYTYSMGN